MYLWRNIGDLAHCSLLRHLPHHPNGRISTVQVLNVTTRGLTSCNELFAGGLAWHVDEKTLKDAFSIYGDVTEVRIMYDRDSGRSRGFGFVHFSNERNAEAAKNGMDGKLLLGHPVRIDYAIGKASAGRSRVVPRISPLPAEYSRTPDSKEDN